MKRAGRETSFFFTWPNKLIYPLGSAINPPFQLLGPDIKKILA